VKSINSPKWPFPTPGTSNPPRSLAKLHGYIQQAPNWLTLSVIRNYGSES